MEEYAIYAGVGLVAIGLIGFLISKIPEHVLFAILDFFAVIIRTIVAIVTAIYTCIKNTAYPIKKNFNECTDSLNFKMNPWKKKVPYTHVPKFSYDSISQNV
jgi:hypothetical protein